MIVFWFTLLWVFNGTMPDFNHDGCRDIADLKISQAWCEQYHRIIASVPQMRRWAP